MVTGKQRRHHSLVINDTVQTLYKGSKIASAPTTGCNEFLFVDQKPIDCISIKVSKNSILVPNYTVYEYLKLLREIDLSVAITEYDAYYIFDIEQDQILKYPRLRLVVLSWIRNLFNSKYSTVVGIACLLRRESKIEPFACLMLAHYASHNFLFDTRFAYYSPVGNNRGVVYLSRVWTLKQFKEIQPLLQRNNSINHVFSNGGIYRGSTTYRLFKHHFSYIIRDLILRGKHTTALDIAIKVSRYFICKPMYKKKGPKNSLWIPFLKYNGKKYGFYNIYMNNPLKQKKVKNDPGLLNRKAKEMEKGKHQFALQIKTLLDELTST